MFSHELHPDGQTPTGLEDLEAQIRSRKGVGHVGDRLGAKEARPGRNVEVKQRQSGEAVSDTAAPAGSPISATPLQPA